MSIDKLSEEDTRNVIVIQKLNELIEAHNELEQKFNEHTHLVLGEETTVPDFTP